MGVAVKYCSVASARRMGSMSPRDENCIDFPNCGHYGWRGTMRTQKATASCRRRLVDALQLGFGIRSETQPEAGFVKEARRAVVVLNISAEMRKSIGGRRDNTC